MDLVGSSLPSFDYRNHRIRIAPSLKIWSSTAMPLRTMIIIRFWKKLSRWSGKVQRAPSRILRAAYYICLSQFKAIRIIRMPSICPENQNKDRSACIDPIKSAEHLLLPQEDPCIWRQTCPGCWTWRPDFHIWCHTVEHQKNQSVTFSDVGRNLLMPISDPQISEMSSRFNIFKAASR